MDNLWAVGSFLLGLCTAAAIYEENDDKVEINGAKDGQEVRRLSSDFLSTLLTLRERFGESVVVQDLVWEEDVCYVTFDLSWFLDAPPSSSSTTMDFTQEQRVVNQLLDDVDRGAYKQRGGISRGEHFGAPLPGWVRFGCEYWRTHAARLTTRLAAMVAVRERQATAKAKAIREAQTRRAFAPAQRVEVKEEEEEEEQEQEKEKEILDNVVEGCTAMRAMKRGALQTMRSQPRPTAAAAVTAAAPETSPPPRRKSSRSASAAPTATATVAVRPVPGRTKRRPPQRVHDGHEGGHKRGRAAMDVGETEGETATKTRTKRRA